MLYDLVSDLHVDLNEKKLRFDIMQNPHSKVLVVAGDVSNDPMITVQTLRRAAAVYDHVIFVDGNHDHYANGGDYDGDESITDTRKYGVSVQDTIDWFAATLGRYKNITYLSSHTRYVIIDEVAFVGDNAWYDFEYLPEGADQAKAHELWYDSNDIKRCNFSLSHDIMSVANVSQRAREQAFKMQRTVEALQTSDKVKKIVIVTHTVPVREALIWKTQNSIDPLDNGAYGNSKMMDVYAADKNERIVHSVFGHTHFPYDFTLDNGIRFVCNPRGYSHESYGRDRKYKPVQLDTDDTRGKLTSAFGEVEE